MEGFRELARKKKEIPMEECIKILKQEKRGVLSVNGDNGYPYGMPINHFYNEEDGLIYFHTGKTGHRTDSIKKNDKASFCVYDGGYREGDDWALNIKSVIVFGRIVEVTETDRIYDIARRLSHKFTFDEKYIDEEIEKHGPKTMMFYLRPEHICGKLVKES